MFKAIILDLDGTLYCGEEVIKGVPAVIRMLRKKGIKIFFISNASMRTRSEQAEKLNKMGIKCQTSEMYNTAYATAVYIKKNYPKANILTIDAGGLSKEIKMAGLKLVNSERADIVATGLDPNITFEKLKTALRAILNGAVFIASNVDRIYPTEKGLLPGSGTIAAFLSYGSRKKPIIIGKPKTHLIDAVLRDNKINKNEVLIVGDSPETDIKVAKRMKIKCALVLTGLTKLADAKKLPKNMKPDFVLKSAAALSKII